MTREIISIESREVCVTTYFLRPAPGEVASMRVRVTDLESGRELLDTDIVTTSFPIPDLTKKVGLDLDLGDNVVTFPGGAS